MPFVLFTLIYFFICEATGAQTVGKRRFGLRVMRRDGGAPTVNQISVRTVLRLIDDGPIGLVVMLLSGKRRQRIGDLLAGTAVGEAGASVPSPASSPLLFVYPVGWLIGAVVWFAAGSEARDEESYRTAVQAICRHAAETSGGLSAAEMIPYVEARYAEHAALVPPASMRSGHAELLAIEREDLAIGRRIAAIEASGRRTQSDAIVIGARVRALYERQRVLMAAGVPVCGSRA
jgi:hypothetical protein